ncbi:MAG: hypothetical protein M1823_000077 [Watsoniomyces obsoletus]|nr:MAG: hypothetical protein M1823_000077 [Watsoniomyces obsoletus]
MPPFVPRKRAHSPPAVEVPLPPAKPVRPTRARKPTLFDTADASPRSGSTLEQNRAYLKNQQNDDSSSSSLSDVSSSEFEDVEEPGPSKKRRKVDDDDEEEDVDEEIDWEDAVAPTSTLQQPGPSHEPSGDLELTLDKTASYSFTNPHGKKKGPSKIERGIRIRTHCMHVQFLLFHNLVRNAWICDKKVQEILVGHLDQKMKKEVDRWRNASGLSGANMTQNVDSEEPPPSRATKGRTPKTRAAARDWSGEAEKSEPGAPNLSRGDPLIRLLKLLATFWRKKFKITAPGLRKQGYTPLPILEAKIASYQCGTHDPEEHGERIKDVKEFRELAQKCEGSRDVGAQLFTALLRGLGLETRMVANLQPIGFGWSQAEEASIKKKRKEDGTENGDEDVEQPDEGSTAASEDSEDDRRAPPRARRNARPLNREAGRQASRRKSSTVAADSPDSSSTDELTELDEDDLSIIELTPPPKSKASSKVFDKDLVFPIYWTEVLSPVTNQFMPVDALILKLVAVNPEQLASFEPRGAKADKSKQVMAYVVAYSPDGTAKDVTVRYLKRKMWPGKTKGVRMPVEKVPIHNRKGKVMRHEEFDWFKSVMSGYARDGKRRTLADDLEERRDLKPVKPTKTVKEGGETLQGYKNSAEFVLERHLRREEALRPGAKHVKMFTAGKGDKATQEKVFLRKDVLACRTVESWHKEGREVKPGEHPLKLVPARAVTLIRKREIEQAEAEGGEKVKQGLYSKDQTDWIIPPPIQNGIIPKNAYGNIDCYVPSMVPEGAVHIRRRGTAKICRRLEISYAEAVTGFEFGGQRAVPVVEGVVVAVEHEQLVLDAWRADEAMRVQKEKEKQEKAVLTMWKKLLVGLRIVERVKADYGGDANHRDEHNPFTNRKKKADQPARDNHHEDHVINTGASDLAGGFMHEDEEDGSNEGAEPSGFIPPTAVDDDIDVGGGGFLTEDQPRSEGDEQVVSPEMDESNHEDLDMHINGAKEHLKSAKGKGRAKGHERGAASGDGRHESKPSNKRRVNKTRRTTSQSKRMSMPSVEQTSDEEQESEDAQDSDVPKPRAGRAAPASDPSKLRRERPQRRAAREGQKAIASNLIDLNSDEEMEDGTNVKRPKAKAPRRSGRARSGK